MPTDIQAGELRIVHYPEAVLRRRSRPVREFGKPELARARKMLELMYQADGVGLAGPQVAWGSRIVTIDVEQTGTGNRVFLNPVVSDFEGSVEESEGCLSLPGIWAPVTRAERVHVTAYDLRGRRLEFTAEGMAARAWQHEVDHLNGILFIDHLSQPALMAIGRELKALEKAAEEGR